MAEEAGTGPGLPDEEDLGEPIEELRDFEEEVPTGFFARILSSLRRRRLGSEFATLGWSGLAEVFLEFLRIIHSLFQASGTEEGETD